MHEGATARAPLRRGRLVVGGAGLLVAVYLVWAGYLAVFAGEGALPPHWRVPDLPRDARVLQETKECGSGGCWRQLVLSPTGGLTPAGLAAEMGVVDERRESWRLLDPHAVSVGSRVVDDALEVHVAY